MILPKRKPIRLNNYDYSQSGAYFITICVQNRKPVLSPTTISDIVCTFKSLTTRECKKVAHVEKLFQRSFYDHVIRDEYDYQIKWQYIDDNLAKWLDDSLYV